VEVVNAAVAKAVVAKAVAEGMLFRLQSGPVELAGVLHRVPRSALAVPWQRMP